MANPGSGSSPQARGTVAGSVVVVVLMRFIPAGAGNGKADVKQVEVSAVHPRRRGERALRIAVTTWSHGSSPQARGTGHHGLRLRRFHRFIPAGAGNGRSTWPDVAVVTVHPRRRGERIIKGALAGDHTGSSPQARGTGGPFANVLGHSRFIPAGAGNGEGTGEGDVQIPVHPRRRGERGPDEDRLLPYNGSSPQARGTDSFGVHGRFPGRFIPAGAGNGASGTSSRESRSVHPRRRGERRTPRRHWISWTGSSPQARGTAVQMVKRSTIIRFIPAGAGNGSIHRR
ncbi:hypothetical protein D779_2358 [Imhoffiella purpurea]|uniref:Uncharacterized protein n=1 Tax=Imhoffiella purpurea TaxID=1249627 RepID=W9VC59_9GAMM|nr:hypothetical protein D779_2358 [Imhoffiella purpurea]